MSAELIAFFNLIFAPVRAVAREKTQKRAPDAFRRYGGEF
jgi:hypothetical protein